MFLVKRCVVILQGEFNNADVELLGRCLKKMGFSDPLIYWEPEKAIPQEKLEREIGKLVDGVTAGSNLLLIVAARKCPPAQSFSFPTLLFSSQHERHSIGEAVSYGTDL